MIVFTRDTGENRTRHSIPITASSTVADGNANRDSIQNQEDQRPANRPACAAAGMSQSGLRLVSTAMKNSLDQDRPQLATPDWQPTRAAGLARLHAFLPHAGGDYAASRNSDLGPQDRSNISCLSPYIRRRLITEQEVLSAVVQRHGRVKAEKFIQEVFWRNYWKGWLEMRPMIWERYLQQLLELQHQYAAEPQFNQAVQGRTGIACFDAWVNELMTHGWLHNHARMWFASIWIFTLRLPWQLGAEFFYRHLLDADPASNTLSWRWVAGLHTRGKHYLARADNIRQYSQNRFDPAGQLCENALPLQEPEPVAPAIMIAAAQQTRGKPVALLISEEDLHPESWGLPSQAAAVALLQLPAASDRGHAAQRFSTGALEDAATRAATHFGCPVDTVAADTVSNWATRNNLSELVTSHAPVGAVAPLVSAIGTDLAAVGTRLVQLQRPWDSLCWPHADAGFFKLKEKIPMLLQKLGL
jgi:deoxyribodipyrimidine photo-lyase